MPRTKISEFSSTPASNTDIDSINIAEGCAPSGINDAIRELMAQLKDFQVGSAGDPVTVGGVLTVQAGAVGTPAITTAGDTNTGIFFPAADTIAFAEGGVEAMRLDSSGNLGLASTPGAWPSGQGAIQLKNGGLNLWALGGVNGYVYSNAYYDGSTNRYLSNGFANSYAINNAGGIHAWFNAPSGTAGNAITFTQAMTLTAAGNLGLGTTSPLALGNFVSFEVKGASAGLLAVSSGAGAAFGRMYNGGSSVVLGTSTAHPLVFDTNDTERARIDSSGNLLVGTTSTGGRLTVVRSDTGTSLYAQSPSLSDTYTGDTVQIVSQRNASTAYNHLMCAANNVGNPVFKILGNGNAQNTNNSYGAISDAKLKQNIVDASPKLADLMQVKIRNYNLIGDTTKQLGVVAQELETVFPAMVDETPDYEDVVTTSEDGNKTTERIEKGTTTKSVKYSVFVPMLIKAIQEQQAIIESLTTRITALEGQ